ncbi:MAG: hypothetical protein A2V96_01420 [Candidatus Yonathbacteria bacterium RBG_16_43_6]|uniref:Uncharacterized protein n=2 Tax=Parcubacteria group TaxID=1794811 RepID=A0A1G2SB94_9BACT|nr:MAG: hypothetical protein UW78_C0001G0014 [Candidatus Azambacteria bacterium GW2011_GWA1_44_9]OHA78558.1 MAG: hypothetical protein A2658_02100 [Candidatus Yonathbacteria bacterium RIFCSPHIGHO2_01_FULL_44_19]OHA80197.1 MAG: hypothetical protein A2V96_01420 [Candidatus Yonathbacteria bacterium RBG_16_43_6]OHA82296.1 MAG: hypothetical protein A3B07_02045 [Candidatus Yonathbacteria bacterium RIFCSPLOWO2_01_FULL_43_27]
MIPDPPPISSIELLLAVIGLMVAIAGWNRTIKRTTTINSWSETSVRPYVEGEAPFISSTTFDRQRHYRIKSIRITCYPTDENKLGWIMFRVEDQNGWLIPNFPFDEGVGHDVKISSDVTRRIWSLTASIGSDGFRQLKFICYNRTGGMLFIRFEPLLEYNFTVGDAIHYFFITWFPVLSKPAILFLNRIGRITSILRIHIKLPKREKIGSGNT